MAVNKAVTRGKEHLILLPSDNVPFKLTTDPPGAVTLSTGGHAVVVSGYAVYEHQGQALDDGLILGLDSDDDDIIKSSFEVVVGPPWRDVRQVSPVVTIAGIVSRDSDEVDHSSWVLRSCKWDAVDSPEGERIRLTCETEAQGAGNGIINFAYQLTATGWLARMPTLDEISADFD